jgi:hypothetical protein
METVQFKTSSGAGAQSFNAVIVEPAPPDIEEEKWVDMDGVLNKEIIFQRLKWNITFGLLTTSEMDYLNALTGYETPQMIYASTTYDIYIEKINAKYKGGTITVINRDPE